MGIMVSSLFGVYCRIYVINRRRTVTVEPWGLGFGRNKNLQSRNKIQSSGVYSCMNAPVHVRIYGFISTVKFRRRPARHTMSLGNALSLLSKAPYLAQKQP